MFEAADVPSTLREGAHRIRRAAAEGQSIITPRLLELAVQFEREAAELETDIEVSSLCA